MREFITIVEQKLMEYMRPDYLYSGCCVDGGHGPGGEAIHIMVDEAQDIAYDQFVRYVGIEQMRDVFSQYYWPRDEYEDEDDDDGDGIERHGGLQMKDDYHLREAYHKSRWYGIDCVYCVQSGIEYIFTRGGASPESEGVDREDFLHQYDEEPIENVWDLNEARTMKIATRNNFGVPAEVRALVNPALSQMANLTKPGWDGLVFRGILFGDDALVWSASEGLHLSVAQALGIPGGDSSDENRRQKLFINNEDGKIVVCCHESQIKHPWVVKVVRQGALLDPFKR